MVVLRNSKTIDINHSDLLVGDVLFLETGNILPVDAIIFESNDIVVDESSMTGESDLIPKKVPKTFEEEKINPFLISGSKIMGN